MNKRKFIIASVIFLIFLAFNIPNDKYYMNYQIGSLTVNNPSDINRSQATIYGDNTNEGKFIKTPKVDLPKGNYKIKIQYNADTDHNYVTISGKTKSQELSMDESEKYLFASDQEKIIQVNLKEDVHNFRANIYFCGKGTLVFRNITIESAHIANTDTIVWILISLIILTTIGILAFHHPSKESRSKILVLLSLLAITGMASYPMFQDYIVQGHDIAFHLTRIEGVKSGLLSGQFPVRVHSSTLYDYGYATSIFYPELFLYIPALLRIFGVSLTGTVQIFVILINFATASIMYFSVYKITKVRGISILSSILYVFANYHLCDIYTRFAIGEALAMTFLPLVIYGVYEVLCNDYTKWKYAVIGATAVLQSHIISTLVTAALVGLAVLLCMKNLMDKKRMGACLKAAVMTFLINIWYLIPLIGMMKQDMNVTSLGRDVDELSLYVIQLFQNFTVNGESRNIIGNSLEGVMPLHIGFPILLGIMLFAYVLVMKRIQDKKEENLMIVLLGFGILCALSATNLFPWKIIVQIPIIGKMARMIQFPWRFLAFAVTFLSIVAAYGIYYLAKKAEVNKILIVLIFGISVLLASHYFDNFMEKDIYCYKGTIKVNTGIGTGEYYYKGTDTDQLIKRGERIDTSTDKLIVSQYSRENGRLKIVIENSSAEEQYIEVPLAFYPFYKAVLNDEVNLEIIKGLNNVVRIIIPSNTTGMIEIKYVEYKLWRVAVIISILSLAVFLKSFIKNPLKRKFS